MTIDETIRTQYSKLPIDDPNAYEPGVSCYYCSTCQEFSLFWDEDDGIWLCSNCDEPEDENLGQ